MISLYVNHYNTQRQAEINECLIRNASNPYIDRVFVLSQSHKDNRPQLPDKVQWIEFAAHRPNNRPTFRDFFDLINGTITSPYDYSVVANSDVYTDETIRLIKPFSLEMICLCLARWEQGAVRVADNSQDTWIFQGPVRPLGWIDFGMGIPGCDWRLSWELIHGDYFLKNPCYSIKTHHLHQLPLRTGGQIGPPHNPDVKRQSIAECYLPLAGKSRVGLISFSLYGNDRRYGMGAVQNAVLAKHIYPGWTVRYYVDSTVPKDVLTKLRELKTQIVVMPDNCGISGMFWRMLPQDDKGYARWMMRDVDSRLNYRDRRAVDEWVASEKPFHVMRDHPCHYGPINGFAWGGTCGAMPAITSLIQQWKAKGRYGEDEQFLSTVVWPVIKNKTLVHGFSGTPFPTDREAGRFVGERCYEDEHWNHNDRMCIYNYDRETLLVRQNHTGLDDHLIINGGIRILAKSYAKIYLTCPEINQANVKFMYSDLKNVEVVGLTFEKKVHKTIVIAASSFTDWAADFYSCMNLDPSLRYEAFYVPDRPLDQSKSLHPGVPYLFVHDLKSHATRCQLKIDSDLPQIKPEISGTIFDYKKLIQEAAQVHCVDSCFAVWVDQAQLNQNSFVHVYATKTPNPTYKNVQTIKSF